MFNASSYPPQTIDTFEILGGYVVSIFYNHIYDKAKELHAAGKSSSTTEAYKAVSRTYLMHFTKEDLFKTTLKDIYTYFNAHSTVPVLGYTDWVNQTTKEFVPTDYWSSLNSKQKDHILGLVIEAIYRKFAIVMLSPRGLAMVVDNHKERTNIPFLQDKMIGVMIEEREKMYQKFVKPLGGSKSDGLAERLREDLLKETKKTGILKSALVKANATIKSQASQIDVLLQTKNWLMNKAKQLQSTVDQLHVAKPPVVTPVSTQVSTPVSTPVGSPPASPPASPADTPVDEPFDAFEEIDTDDIDISNIKRQALAKRKDKIALLESSKKLDIESDDLFNI